MLFKLAARDVDDVEQEVRFGKLVERRPKGADQLPGQIADETDRVGNDGLRVTRKAQTGAFGVERGEELVFRTALCVSVLRSVDLPALV